MTLFFKSLTLKVWLAKVLLLVLTVPGVHTYADNFPKLHTFGFSIGTNTDYCSIESVNGKLALSCENLGYWRHG